MSISARTLIAGTACLAVLGLLAPMTASAQRAPAEVWVTPDCSVPLIPTLPADPSLLGGCADEDSASFAPMAGAEAATACEAMVPLVDSRCEAWTAGYDGPVGGPDQPTSELGGSRLVAASPNSSTIFAAGASDSSASTASGWAGLDMDVAVAAFDAEKGTSRWSFRLPHPDQSLAHNIVADPDGDLVYVTSHDYQDIGDCVRTPATVAIRQATGEQVWAERESTPDEGCINVYSTAVDPAGERLFIVASADGSQGRLEQTVFARDADTGDPLWTASAAASPNGESGSAVAVSPDGSRVYVGGSVLSLDGSGYPRHSAWAIRGYDTTTGQEVLETIWNAPYPTSNSPMNPPAALAVSPDGSSVYAVGGVDHVPGRFFDITAVAFDTSSGQQKWMYRYDGPRQKSSFDSVWYNGPLAISANGSRLAIAGYSTHFAVGVNLQLDLATVFVDTANGQQLWATRYTAENETNWIPSVALSPDASKVYVAAPSRYAVKWELPARYTTQVYNAADGSVAWTARHSEGHSFAMGSVLTPDGKRFVVTGMTAAAGTQTVGTVNWNIGLAAYTTA